MEMIELNNEQDVAVIKPTVKRLDAAVALAFKTEVLKVVESGQTRLVLDLDQVQFMDSSGLGSLVSILKGIGNRGQIGVCHVKGAVLSLFQLTRMDKVFDISDTKEQAVQRLVT